MTRAQRADLDERQRSRILGALAACIGGKGYAATTIADIARQARVSKSTVYVHFRDKDDIFMALYSTASDRVIEVISQAAEEASRAGLGWREQITASLGAYLAAMAAGRDLSRCLVVEAPAVSPRALALRAEVLERYVDALHGLAVAAAREDAEVPVPPRSLILGLLGGINEYMLQVLASDGRIGPKQATAEANQLVSAVIDGYRGAESTAR